MAAPAAAPTAAPTSAPQARNETRGSVLASELEIGASFWAKFMGLMGRASLPPGRGLWLPGDNGIHMFFMRFPIDAIFVSKPLRGDGAAAGGAAAAPGVRRVLAAARDLRPWTGIVPLVRGADGVLELPAGTIAASGTEVGDVLRIG